MSKVKHVFGLTFFKLALLTSSVLGIQVAYAVDKTMYMFPGESQLLTDPGITNVVVGSDEILNAIPTNGKGIVITAKKTGDTTLKLWNNTVYRTIEFHVYPANLVWTFKEVNRFLAAYPTIKSDIIGDKVVVSGGQLEPSSKAKVDVLLSSFGSNVLNLVSTSNEVQGAEGQMIYLDVRVVELSSQNLKDIGIAWGGTINGPTIAASGMEAGFSRVTTMGPRDADGNRPISPFPQEILNVANLPYFNAYLGVITKLDSKINLMQQSGSATVVARPLLSCKNGGKASFLSGGQIPYSTTSNAGTQTEFKDYGIKLEVEPLIKSSGDIQARITAELSDVDPSTTVNSQPGLLIRKTETEFSIEPGKTLVLSGLVSINKSKTKSQIPLLGSIPIIGNLFKDRSSASKQTELVFFVTPYIYKSVKGIDGVLKNANAIVDDAIQSAPLGILNDSLAPSNATENTNADLTKKRTPDALKSCSTFNKVLNICADEL